MQVRWIIIVVLLMVVSIAAAQDGPPPSVHAVEEGQTIFRIALRYGVLPDAIRDVNGLHNEDAITAGQVLAIPAGSADSGGRAAIPEGFDALTLQSVTLREGPGAEYGAVMGVSGGYALMVEGRAAPKPNGEQWVLVAEGDTNVRGWVSWDALQVRAGLALADLPATSADTLAGPTWTPAIAAFDPTATPEGWRAPATKVAEVGGAPAETTGNLNVRHGPGTDHSVIVSLRTDTPILLEGRSADGRWLLAHTPDGTYRGWVFADYVSTEGIFQDVLAALPVTNEIMAGGSVVVVGSPTLVNEQPVTYTGDWRTTKLAPRISWEVRRIYQRGQQLGRDPRVIAKVGDCTTVDPKFLEPITDPSKPFDLGPYGYLERAILQFGGGFTRDSVAASVAFPAAGVLDPQWADPGLCEGGEMPLACEYRLINPSVALIMLGTQDVITNTPEGYEVFMRRIIEFSVEQGVIPVISTLYEQRTDAPVQMTVEQANAILRRLAAEYQVPLWELDKALEVVPDRGVTGDGRHLNDEGYYIRNLTALQVLDAILQKAMY